MDLFCFCFFCFVQTRGYLIPLQPPCPNRVTAIRLNHRRHHQPPKAHLWEVALVWRNLGCTRARSKSPVSSASAATKHSTISERRRERREEFEEVRWGDLGTPWSAQWGPRTRRPSRSCGNRGLVRCRCRRRRPSPAAFEGAEPWVRICRSSPERFLFIITRRRISQKSLCPKIETAPRRRVASSRVLGRWMDIML